MSPSAGGTFKRHAPQPRGRLLRDCVTAVGVGERIAVADQHGSGGERMSTTKKDG